MKESTIVTIFNLCVVKCFEIMLLINNIDRNCVLPSVVRFVHSIPKIGGKVTRMLATVVRVYSLKERWNQ